MNTPTNTPTNTTVINVQQTPSRTDIASTSSDLTPTEQICKWEIPLIVYDHWESPCDPKLD